MIDPRHLWDFDDPSGSEVRLRTAADLATGADRSVLLSQVARALGLQERYAEGHVVLDDLATLDPEVAVRVCLERGRLLRSAGDREAARPHFAAAAQSADAAGLEWLHVDALHMLALVADPDDVAEQLRLTEAALAAARAARDPAARDWDGSLLNNLAMVHADRGDFEAALPIFEAALTACRRVGDPGRIRVARWMVGWTLRNLGRTDEALAIQRDLRAELDAAGLDDPFVDDELGLLEPGTARLHDQV